MGGVVIVTEDSFLWKVCAEPDDDGPRIQYAHWLQENGRELSQIERAEFILIQCELAAMPERKTHNDDALESHGPDYWTTEDDFYDGVAVGERIDVWGEGVFRGKFARKRSGKFRLHGLLVKEKRDDGIVVLKRDEQSKPYPHKHAAALRERERQLRDRNVWEGPILERLQRENFGPVFQWKRGFIDKITCTIHDLCGGPCPSCEGVGDDAGRLEKYTVCPICHGSGDIPGIGELLLYGGKVECNSDFYRVGQRHILCCICNESGFVPAPFLPSMHPVERVNLTGVQAFSGGDHRTRWWHHRLAEGGPSFLPTNVFESLTGFTTRYQTGKCWPTEADANAALVAALVELYGEREYRLIPPGTTVTVTSGNRSGTTVPPGGLPFFIGIAENSDLSESVTVRPALPPQPAVPPLGRPWYR